MMSFSPIPKRNPGLTLNILADHPLGLTSKNWLIFRANTSRKPMMLRCCMNLRDIWLQPLLPP